MRLSCSLPSFLTLTVLCHMLQIFDLQQSIEQLYGRDVNFYSLLNLTSSATSSDIKTAYRKRSVELHPDKHPLDPDASKKFERLGLVNKILRDSRRDRYDYFLKRGFPKWRGTGWVYVRWRPGMGTVLAVLVLLSSGIELLIKRITYSKNVQKAKDLQRGAFYTAWGPRFHQALFASGDTGLKVPTEKKIKMQLGFGRQMPAGPSQAELASGQVNWDQLEKETRASASTSQSSCCAPSSPTLDLLVTREESGESIVWMMDPNSGEWAELNAQSVAGPTPTLLQSWPVRLVRTAVQTATGGKSQGVSGAADDEVAPEAAPEAKASGAKSSSKSSSKRRK